MLNIRERMIGALHKKVTDVKWQLSNDIVPDNSLVTKVVLACSCVSLLNDEEDNSITISRVSADTDDFLWTDEKMNEFNTSITHLFDEWDVQYYAPKTSTCIDILKLIYLRVPLNDSWTEALKQSYEKGYLEGDPMWGLLFDLDEMGAINFPEIRVYYNILHM